MSNIPLTIHNDGLKEFPSLEISDVSVNADGTLIETGMHSYVRPYESFVGNVSEQKAYIVRRVKTLTPEEVEILKSQAEHA